MTILSKNYENSLFITNEDIYIIGVCGQYSFNINYLELNHTLKNIYVLSSSNNFSYYVNKFKTYPCLPLKTKKLKSRVAQLPAQQASSLLVADI